jgi:hypothetical protein
MPMGIFCRCARQAEGVYTDGGSGHCAARNRIRRPKRKEAALRASDIASAFLRQVAQGGKKPRFGKQAALSSPPPPAGRRCVQTGARQGPEASSAGFVMRLARSTARSLPFFQKNAHAKASLRQA